MSLQPYCSHIGKDYPVQQQEAAEGFFQKARPRTARTKKTWETNDTKP